MIISIDKIKEMSKFADFGADELQREMAAIEQAIRSYTNNNFQDQGKRIKCASAGGVLEGVCPYFRVGDTVEISKSQNAGLYVITAIEGTTTLDRELYAEASNLVTKIEYPADVVAGALGLLDWKLTKSDKIGVQSESISRHSVTYTNLDGTNSKMGYPISLFGFLAPYRKVRF